MLPVNDVLAVSGSDWVTVGVTWLSVSFLSVNYRNRYYQQTKQTHISLNKLTPSDTNTNTLTDQGVKHRRVVWVAKGFPFFGAKVTLGRCFSQDSCMYKWVWVLRKWCSVLHVLLSLIWLRKRDNELSVATTSWKYPIESTLTHMHAHTRVHSYTVGLELPLKM